MSSATRTAGTRLGPYEVVARLGAGGMGEVYRARDTKLNRDVALKFLPESVAGDAARLARFEYEAQTLASLNHPNIAQVYGFLDGALVMELLDGETLAERLSAGPLPVRKAVEYGSQIARGLAAAHDRGIVHRDLKPDNVFVLRDGHVKIIDFGLAREVVPVSSIETAMTIAQTRTEPGVLMGTVGYMAPEQIRGDPLDARADLFSFGSVLYEMLTGQRAFKRETAAETMTAILREDPTDLVAARPEVSPGLERIVRHCLEKNAIERFQTARDVAFALDTLTGSTRRDPVVPAVAFSKVRAKRSGIERAVWASLVSLLALAIAWLLIRTPSQSPASVAVVYRALVPLPEGVAMATATTPLFRLAISADGRRLAFVGTRLGRPPTIWVQSTDESEARELAGTENGFGPILSPDGKSIAFSVNQTLKRVDLDGGSPVTVGPEVHGQWTRAGEIVATTGPPQWSLRRLAIRGGSVVDVLKPSPGERFGVPSLLPDGRHFVFGRFSGRAVNGADTPDASLEMASFDSKEPVISLLHQSGAANLQYASGALVYAQADRILAQPFDPVRLQLSGEPVALADHVEFAALGSGGAAFALSESGTLVYQAQEAAAGSQLTWMDREGHVLSTVADVAEYSNVELSRDGQRLALSVRDPAKSTRDIYLVDLARGVRQRLTFDESEERTALWFPDGRALVYNSQGLDLYRRPADFTGREEPVQTDHASKDPRDISPDGQRLLYRRTGEGTGNDIWMMPLSGDRTPVPLLNSVFDENYAVFSPDARSMVYVSNESGRNEVYVMSLEGGGGKVQISTGGGTFPRWRRDGHEITYLSLDQMVMGVSVTGSGPAFRAGPALPLFKINPQPGAGTPYDVTSDGKRFIVNARLPERFPPALQIVVNWPALLPKKDAP